MAILVNMGQRGFVLKEGMLNPGGTLTVDSETASMLSRAYPKEIKVIEPEKIKVEEPKVVVPEVQHVAEPVKEEAPKKKRAYKRKAK